MGDAVHVVDLRGQQQLADIGEDPVGLDAAGAVRRGVDRARDTAGIKTLDDLDELDHALAQVRRALDVEPVGLGHEHAGADQQVAEACARTDAGVPVMGRVGLGEKLRMVPLAGQEHALPRHEHVVEDHHPGGLAVARAERRRLLPRPARRAGDDGHAIRIHRHRAADREVRIVFRHVAAGHDQIFVDIGGGGDDRLGAPDDDAVWPAPGDVDVGIAHGLFVRAARAVALAVGHGDAEGEVVRLHPVEIGEEALVQRAAALPVHAPGRLVDRVEAVLGEIALGAAGALAGEAYRFELVELVGGRAVDVEEAVDLGARALFDRHHRMPVTRVARQIVGDPERGHARREARLVGDRRHRVAVHIDTRRQAPQRLAVILGGHEHRSAPVQPTCASRCLTASAIRSTRSAFSQIG